MFSKIYREQASVISLLYESKSTQQHHPPSVDCLDINSQEPNLIVTGGNNGSATVWDATSSSLLPTLTLGPMSSSPNDEILSVEWNRQVKSIFATASNTNVHVYDTRKKDQTTPIMRVYDSNATTTWGVGAASAMYAKSVVWSHSHGTTLLVANSNDANPFIQLWDLRYTASPIKYLKGGHTRGIASMSWNSYDEELLLSAAKDNSVCAWNPAANQNEEPLLAILPSISNQFINQIVWCPWEPSLFAIGAFDGHTSVYNLTQTNQARQENNQILESFGLDSPFLPPQQQQQTHYPSQQQKQPPILSKAPKWMRIPSRASWAVG